jgi:AcrR family transcriptional regulator
VVQHDRAPAEGLRERKKRRTRELLSDTATRMFLDRGFDAVRVAEVAAEVGVSEKTVYNYFPAKEALLLDRLEATVESLRAGLADPTTPPVRAAVHILAAELRGMVDGFEAWDDPRAAMAAHRRFGDLIRSTPALRAYQSEMMDRFVGVAAEALARRHGGDRTRDPDDPQCQVAAAALLALWRVQLTSLRAHVAGAQSPADVHRLVSADVDSAAALLERGLRDL